MRRLPVLTTSAMSTQLCPQQTAGIAPAATSFSYDGNFRGHYLQTILKYQFSKQLAIFCDWTNSLDQTVVRVQGKDRYRPQKIRYNGMRYNIGLSGNF